MQRLAPIVISCVMSELPTRELFLTPEDTSFATRYACRRIVVEVSTHFYLYGRERTIEDRNASLRKMKEREKERETLGETGEVGGAAEVTPKKKRPAAEVIEDNECEKQVDHEVRPLKRVKNENGVTKSNSKAKAGTPKKEVMSKKRSGNSSNSSKISKVKSQVVKRKIGDSGSIGPKGGSSPKKRLKEELQTLAKSAVPNYKGVYREKGKYAAKLVHKGKLVHLGLHDKAVAAARAYDEGLKKHKAEGEPNFGPVKERAKRSK